MKISKKTQIFNRVAVKLPKRNIFDLSHERMFTTHLGKLTPILCEEVNPNETWDVGGKTLVRTLPLVAPTMSTITITKHHFFIRNQILWANWNRFMTGGDKFNEASPDPIPPFVYIPEGGFSVGGIADHLGFPTQQGGGTKVSALPFAAYLRVYQEYYANEALQYTTLIMLTDGDNTSALEAAFNTTRGTSGGFDGPCFNVNWSRDYFTSCLPEPQKGPEVTIPLGETAPLEMMASSNPDFEDTTRFRNPVTGIPVGPGGVDADSSGYVEINGSGDFNIDITGHTRVNLSTAVSATINSLRQAFAIQRLYERLARAGSRTMEFLRAVWGAHPANLELDRPDYFGGAKEFLSVSEVLQQSQTTIEGDDPSPLGTMGGHGVALLGGKGRSYTTNDYGIIMSMFFVKPKALYSQGVRKSWLRLNDRFDYYFPDLAHIGEQPVLNAELYLTGVEEDNNGTFGYLPYGTELRYIPDTVHGQFKSTLDHWLLAREFAGLPALNEDFVRTNTSTMTNIFADISSSDQIIVQHYNHLMVKRCIPLYGTPM